MAKPLCITILFFCTLLFNTAKLTATDSSHAPFGLPVSVKSQTETQTLTNKWWTTGWSSGHKTPIWAAYHLPHVTKPFPSTKRPSRFHRDERIESPSHEDYTNSGFNRGHLVPNHAMATLRGREAQLATFAMTNIAPQPAEHNQGPWRILEANILAWSQERGGVWVITGLAYDDTEEDTHSDIEVPDAWWKVVLDQAEDETWTATAYWLEEDALRKDDPHNFRTSIDHIEKQTGLDLLADLPDELEAELEAKVITWEPAEPFHSPSQGKPANSPADGLIHLNKATQEELETLPGIGPTLAGRIIAERPFLNIKDITKVKGIGDGKLHALRNLVTVD